ncbi:MAG: hypothetical protein ACFFBP_05990 [Promethearchaeota archaeon]
MKESSKQAQINLNFLDFSVLDGIILMLLLHHQEPIKRYNLFLEVNQLLQHSTFNKFNKALLKNINVIIESNKNIKFKDSISASSFYNRLLKLNSRLLVKLNKNKNGKILTIEKTPYTRIAINMLYQNYTSNMLYSKKFTQNSIKHVNKMINYKLEKILICGVFDYLYASTWNTELMFDYTDSVYFITEKERDDEYFKAIGFKDIKFSIIDNLRIGEPDDIFDLALVPNYSKNLNIRGLSCNDILSELVRVTKSDKAVVLTCFSEIESVTNYYVNTILTQLKKALYPMIFTPGELKQDLEKAGLVKIEIENYKGKLIGIGWKS